MGVCLPEFTVVEVPRLQRGATKIALPAASCLLGCFATTQWSTAIKASESAAVLQRSNPPTFGISARNRIIGWMLLLVSLALVVEVSMAARVFTERAEEELDRELVHEGEKLRDFVGNAVDPTTNAPFLSADALLTAYIDAATPASAETIFSLKDGRPSRLARGVPRARLDRDEEFLSMVGNLTESTHGRSTSEAGPIHWAVIPVRVEGDPTSVALVVIEFAAPALDRVASTVRSLGLISAIALTLAGLASWLVAGAVLAPIRTLRQTAEDIGKSDLGRRIAVVGRDDVAALAHTFNSMLDRLQGAFDGQQRFLDDATHELRTPITVVRGHLEQMGDAPAERQRTLHLVMDELARMNRLVDDLVLLARAQRPDFLRPTEIHVSDLIMDVLAKSSTLGERRWIVDGLPEQSVIADGQRLTQALMQLAANAVRHTTVGETITIGATIAADRLQLAVADEGSGIADADKAAIFDRFTRAGFRGDGGSRGEGAGLGLAIVASIARGHGGKVLLDTELGKGATFTLDLPLVMPGGSVDGLTHAASSSPNKDPAEPLAAPRRPYRG